MSEETTAIDVGENNTSENEPKKDSESLNVNESEENEKKEEVEDQVSKEDDQKTDVNRELHSQSSVGEEENAVASESIQNEDAQDHGVQNNSTQEDVEKPDVEEHNVEKPDVEKPDVEKPDVEKPDIEKTDGDRSDPGKTDDEKTDDEHSSDDVPKVVDDLVSKVDDPPMEDAELEQLDARLTPPPPLSGDETVEADRNGEKSSNFGEGEMDEVDDSDFATYDREQLLQQYKDALEERARIQQLNQQYQHKLAEYFKKKKTDDKGQELEKNVTDQEQRYVKYMSNLEELQATEARQANSIEIQLQELKGKCQEKQSKVEEASASFMTFKYEIAKNSINSRSGKPIPQKDLEQLQLAEQKKENEVIAIRLENIKLKNRLKKREQQLKAKEELAEGLHLIDFEQLKIENQTYNEKIEERNEELLKLRKKINSTVQVLTHLKEKLQHVQGENAEQRGQLREIDSTVAKKRDLLTRMKQSRDSLRFDNSKLKHKAGLLGNKPLLKDFEVRKDESEELRQRLAQLKERHFELNIALNGVKKKIDSTKGMR